MSLYNDKIKTLAASLATYPPLPPLSSRVSGDFTLRASVDNPLCGDRIRLAANCQQGQISALRAEVRGCLLCQGATAIALAAVKRAPLSAATLAQVSAQWADFLQSNRGTEQWQATQQSAWQELVVFAPLQAHKSRQGCVQLIFEGLEHIFQQAEQGKSCSEPPR